MPTIVPLQRANHGCHFRAYGLRGAAALIDPFIGVDQAWMSAPTFPPHPHAGCSAVSYVFMDSEIGIANRDAVGTVHLIEPGAVHWTVAGSGVVHEELPAQWDKTVHSLQILVKLPPAKRAASPYAFGLMPQQVPKVQRPGAKVRVVAGGFGGRRSPADAPTDVDVLDISLDAGTELGVPIAPGRSAFILPVFGVVSVDGLSFGLEDLQAPVYLAEQTERELRLQARNGPAKLMVFSGTPMRAEAAMDLCPPPQPMWSHFATTPARYADICSSDDEVPE